LKPTAVQRIRKLQAKFILVDQRIGRGEKC